MSNASARGDLRGRRNGVTVGNARICVMRDEPDAQLHANLVIATVPRLGAGRWPFFCERAFCLPNLAEELSTHDYIGYCSVAARLDS